MNPPSPGFSRCVLRDAPNRALFRMRSTQNAIRIVSHSEEPAVALAKAGVSKNATPVLQGLAHLRNPTLTDTEARRVRMLCS